MDTVRANRFGSRQRRGGRTAFDVKSPLLVRIFAVAQFELARTSGQVAEATTLRARNEREVSDSTQRCESIAAELRIAANRRLPNPALLNAMRGLYRMERQILNDSQGRLATAQQREQRARAALAAMRNRERSLERLLRAERPQKIRTLDLAARLVSRAPDITRMLDKLENRGLIDRDRPATNRRIVHIGITPAGIALLDELQEPIRACHARQLGHMRAADLARLNALLRAARAPHEDEDSTWR